jgi:hypothetical protein
MQLVGSEPEHLETWMCLESSTGLEDGMRRQSKRNLLSTVDLALAWSLKMVDGVLQRVHLGINRTCVQIDAIRQHQCTNVPKTMPPRTSPLGSQRSLYSVTPAQHPGIGYWGVRQCKHYLLVSVLCLTRPFALSSTVIYSVLCSLSSYFLTHSKDH